RILSTRDSRIVFPGFVYGTKTHALMKHAYAYIQPSDVEGLSPVILENMGLRTPIICSDIQENRYVVGNSGKLFRKSDIDDLLRVLQWSVDHPEELAAMGEEGYQRASSLFSWDNVTREHVRVFKQHVSKPRPIPDTRSAPHQHSSDG
ncbi:MAG: glycosyltransferase, partial [Lautropia sp.]